MEQLELNNQKYEIKEFVFQDKKITVRAFENIIYVEKPVDEIQKLNIYVPEAYYQGQSINGYNIHTAPILIPNTVGGYKPGQAIQPGKPLFQKDDVMFKGLQHGYVVVSPGIRGRGLKDNVGCAPACIVDYKAAVRYLRYNKERIAGDTEKIISNGTSAGGALSSLLGATGNHPDYDSYLKQLGAADVSDEIFGASCYCPITNLDHADMAYEWEFSGINDYHRIRHLPNHEIKKIEGELTDYQIKMSQELKVLFNDYFESLHLQNQGHEMSLEDLKDYIKNKVIASANKAIKEGHDLTSLNWLTIKNNQVTNLDYDAYIQYRTRMKPTPAFDNVEMGTPENELFGTKEILYQHFTPFSTTHSLVNGQKADDHIIKMMNPMNYINDPKAKKAQYYRIRHGAIDRDTSLAISAILAIDLQSHGINVDHFYPWGVVHDGDYDLKELFAWIDQICQ